MFSDKRICFSLYTDHQRIADVRWPTHESFSVITIIWYLIMILKNQIDNYNAKASFFKDINQNLSYNIISVKILSKRASFLELHRIADCISVVDVFFQIKRQFTVWMISSRVETTENQCPWSEPGRTFLKKFSFLSLLKFVISAKLGLI